MAKERSVLGVLRTPIREDGTRAVVLLRGDIENIYDRTTGKSLKQIISEITFPVADESNNGLMSTTHVSQLTDVFNSRIITQKEEPSGQCIWFKVDTEESQ